MLSCRRRPFRWLPLHWAVHPLCVTAYTLVVHRNQSEPVRQLDQSPSAEEELLLQYSKTSGNVFTRAKHPSPTTWRRKGEAGGGRTGTERVAGLTPVWGSTAGWWASTLASWASTPGWSGCIYRHHYFAGEGGCPAGDHDVSAERLQLLPF